ncbi:hypothetical protein G6F42_013051 [Rhizopus arrhizus]|nr:hypothetical protein G6F42_013051 [Rhizopus arrhizus]
MHFYAVYGQICQKVQRDYLIAMNSEAPEDAFKADELREALSNLEKHVKALTSGMKVHRVPNSGLKISKRDLPKFQFEDSKMKPFPNEDAYKSVDHFLSEFEKIVHSSGQEIQDVWKKYIPLTLPFDLDDWLQNIVLKAATWADVKSTFHKKFGTTISKLHKRRAVMTMTIGEDETVDEYASRFFRTVGEAGYHRDDLTIGDIFLLGLPEEWQFNLSTVLLSRTKREAWTSSEILDFATNLMGERTPNTYFASRKGDDVSGNRKRKVPVTTGVAAVSNAAGLSAALENGLPKARMLGDKNQPNRAAKTAVPCRHCGRAWRHGHTCEEYRAQKRQKNASVLSVASTSKGEENEAVEPVNYYKEQYENEIYKCKSKKTTNGNMKLITPLLLNNRRIIGKVDPGSDISFINKSILNKTFSNIQTIKTNGFLNFLSVNDDNKNSAVTRVGKTEPMEVTYTNNIKFTHEFEVIEFNNELSTEFDVLLGVDILPKMNIYLQGVAYKFPDSERENELKQFQDINHDRENKYNPENADYGTPNERKELLAQIQPALDKNMAIPSSAACTMPESVVKIKISDPSNCFVRQYPLAINANAEIKIQLEEWLKDGIVERAKPNPTFHSPLLAVPKRDPLTGKTSKLRICCDLRRINAAISDKDCHENFAVPKIDEIFSKVAGNANVISVLDLKQAYFAFPVSPDSRPSLTFSHNNLTYRWARAPFGLKFLVSQFVYTMSVLFDGIEQELKEELKKIYIKEKKDISQIDNEFQAGICHYLDDIVVFAKTAQANVLMVKLVITRLTKVNMRINTDKCSFFQTSVYLLGFIISKNITKIDTKRLSNIDSWEIPKTTKQIRSLMGVISHLRSYCPMLSKLAAPIDSLRNEKDIKGKWTSLHTDRLQRIKQILMSNQILYAPDPSKPYYMQTDASILGISACLFQKDDLGRTKHIAFASRLLNSAERNWSTNRRETAAIVFGFEKYKPLLWGHNQIIVLCDHLALTYLFTSSTLNNTLQGYLEILGEYNFSVAHIKGMDNILADRLSRLYPVITEDEELVDEHNQQIKKLQKLILLRRAKDHPQIIKQKKVYSNDKNLNVLAVKLDSKSFKETTTDYVCPPESDRIQIIKEAHQLGHFGESAVVKHIHTYHGLHWSTIYQDVKGVLKSCRECAIHNIAKRGYNPMKSVVSFEPFEFIGLDMIGPLPVTEKGNCYILIVVDLCTKYIIARPAPNKQSDTIASLLVGIYGDYGVGVNVHLSDNGREFRNSLSAYIHKALNIKMTFSTPFYPQANGHSENAVKTITNTLRKMCGNDTSNWDLRLPIVQLVANMKVRDRTASTPFSLMFARQVNLNPNQKNRNNRRAPTLEELQKRAATLNDIVFPAIQQRTRELTELYRNKFNNKHYILENIPVDTPVMIRLAAGRANKLAPLYSGPYVVVRKTQAGNYILKDDTNELLHREYTPSELKVVSLDETALEEKVYEVEEIRDHRVLSDGTTEYLTKWVGYGERENDWLTPDLFNSPVPIANYWKKIKELRQREKSRNEINNTSLQDATNTSPSNTHKRKSSGSPSRRTKRAKSSQ